MAGPVEPRVTIRIAWWSPRAFPLVIGVLVLASVLAVNGFVLHVSHPLFIALACVPAAYLALRLAAPVFVLGERWMVVPVSGPWYPPVPGPFLAGDGDFHSEGRMVRLADVEGWEASGLEIRLRLRDGSGRVFTLEGIRPADKRRVMRYLSEKLGS